TSSTNIFTPSLHDALPISQSLNVPAVKTLEEVGLDHAKTFAEGLGIKFHEDKILIGDAIGGTETNTTPLQLAGAYSAFGNEGIRSEEHTSELQSRFDLVCR